MKHLPPEVLINIIEVLKYVIGVMAALGVSIFGYAHRSLMKRLDAIDADVKPIRTEIALSQQRLDTHHEDITELKKRVSNLETKIK